MVEEISGGDVHALLKKFVQSRGGESGMVECFWDQGPPEHLLEDLRREYHRLFSDTGPERIALVESLYKPWTQDSDCTQPFANETGHLMGDPAIHLLAVYERCGLEVSEEYRGRPDHLAMELEFLSYLYRWGKDEAIARFLKDHLDWIPMLKKRCQEVHPTLFYNSLLEVLSFFVETERRRLERVCHGEKEIHSEVG